MEQSVFELKRQLSDAINRGDFSNSVVDILLPGGEPLSFEKSCWDYKREYPTKSRDQKFTRDELTAYNCSLAEIVKDIVSFYNSYGGYILFGVSDSPRSLVGVSGDLT